MAFSAKRSMAILDFYVNNLMKTCKIDDSSSEILVEVSAKTTKTLIFMYFLRELARQPQKTKLRDFLWPTYLISLLMDTRRQ
jgi:hypothetical protein